MTSLAPFRRLTSWTLLGACLLAVYACRDLLVSPDEQTPTAIAVSYQFTNQTAAGAANPGNAFDEADRARVRLMRGETVVFDTILPFTPAAEARLRIELKPIEATLTLILELRRGQDILFRGTQTVAVRPHENVAVVVPITAVAARVVVPDSLRVSALSDTIQLLGAAVFATGDTVPDAVLVWTALDPALVEVTPAGRLVSLSNGQARVVGSLLELSDTLLVRVEQVAARVDVTPNPLTLARGTSALLSASAVDARGAAMPGGAFVWTSANPLIAAVDGAGSVQALAAGQTMVTATRDAISGSAQVTVAETTPPQVTITSPVDGSTSDFAQVVAFAGTATEQGVPLDASSLVWRSSVDGLIGSGASFTKDNLSVGAHTITLTATGSGGSSGSSSIQITVVESLVNVPATLFAPLGGTSVIPVQLSRPAPSGGVTVTLTSDDPSLVTIRTPTLVFAAGESLANGAIEGVAPGTATVTVAAAGSGYRAGASRVSTTATLQLSPASIQYEPLFGAPVTVGLQSGGSPVAAPGGGVSVTLTAVDPACVAAPSPVTIAAGQTSTTASLTYGGAAALPCNTTLSASSGVIQPAVTDVRVNALPQVQITAPAAASATDYAQAINFAGTTTPALPPGASFVWTSSLDGQIGTGTSFSKDNLSVGSHTITLTVTGNTSFSSASSIGIVVNESFVSVPTTLNVPYTRTTSLPVQLSRPAPTGGVTLTLMSADPARVTVVTPTLFIAAGQSTANAVVEGTVPGPADVTITAPGTGYRTGVTRVTTTANLLIAPASLTYDVVFPGQVTISLQSAGTAVAAPPGGISVALSTLNPACSAVPSPVTIAAGLVSTTATLTYGGTAATPCTTSLAAESGPITPDTIPVRVNPPPSVTAGTFPTVGSGLQTGQSSGGNLGASTHGGVVVTVTSSDPAIALVSPDANTPGSASIQIPVNNGSTFFTYHVQGIEGATGSVTITASAPGFIDGTTTVNVAQPGFQIGGLVANPTTFSGDDAFFVSIGVPNGAGTALQSIQSVRAGGTALTVNLSNSNASVGELVTTAGTAQAASVQILPGQSSSPSTVLTGGVALRPAGAGTTVVTSSIAGLLPMNGASATVTVTAPSINAGTFPTVGSGLQTGQSSGGSLGASNHGGVTITVSSSDPLIALVSPDAATPGAASIQITMPNTTTFFTYHLQGVEGATGAVTITASAPGFVNGTANVTVVQAGFGITGLTANTTTLTGDDPFVVQVGVPNATQTALQSVQAVRAGGTPLLVQIANNNAVVGALVTSAGTGQSADLTLQPGQFNTPTSVAAGGVALRPLAAGATTVTALINGLVATTAASATVNVTAPTINAGTVPTVGAGLQTGQSSGGNLGASSHGGVTVTVRSSDPAIALVSPNATTPGTESIQLTVNDGSALFLYHVQGVEGAAGAVTITASAPGFVAGTTNVTVVQPGQQITTLATSTTTLTTEDPFWVQVGVPNGAGTALQSVQAVRAGGSTLTVNLTNSNAIVGQFVTTAGPSQSATVLIQPTQSNSPTTVNSGGIALQPTGAGTTTVTSAITGYRAMTGAAVAVTVSAPQISAGIVPTVGAGLQTGQSSGGSLGATDHGGVTVTVRSSNPSVALVSPNATTPGTESIQLTLNDGSTFFTYHVQGVDGASGTVTITASAPGFVDGTTSATVVQAGYNVVALNTSTTTFSPDDDFFVQVGVPNAPRTALQSVQAVRAGGTALTFNINNSNPASGTLVTSGGPTQNTSQTILPGQSNTPTTVASGGVAFRAVNGGSTNISAAIAGLIASAGTVTVNVATPAINAGSAQTVGGGLQTSVNGSLGASNHGGATVTIVSSNPQILVAPNATTPGSASINVTVNNGQVAFTYVVQALEGATATATITASATGFTNGTTTASATGAGYQIVSLPSTINASSGDRAFQVQVGVPNLAQTALSAAQAVRAGASPLTVNLTSSNGAAALIVSIEGAGPSNFTTIQPGQSNSPNTVAAGGAAVRPVAAGSTTIRAVIATLIATTAAAVNLTVQ